MWSVSASSKQMSNTWVSLKYLWCCLWAVPYKVKYYVVCKQWPYDKALSNERKEMPKRKNDTKGNDDIELAEIKSFQPSEAAM